MPSVQLDTGSFLVRRINIATRSVTTLAGQPGISNYADGTSSAAAFSDPFGIAMDGNGSVAFVVSWCR